MARPRSGINDFVIKIGNVNGTGSASANGLLMRALFRMGLPVSGKNYFPSNIQGLPTWYEIRVNRDGYLAAGGRVDIMVAKSRKLTRPSPSASSCEKHSSTVCCGRPAAKVATAA